MVIVKKLIFCYMIINLDSNVETSLIRTEKEKNIANKF